LLLETNIVLLCILWLLNRLVAVLVALEAFVEAVFVELLVETSSWLELLVVLIALHRLEVLGRHRLEWVESIWFVLLLEWRGVEVC